MNGPLHWILTIGLSVAGLLTSIVYLIVNFRRRPTARSTLTGQRPWRPAGAVLCAVVSILVYVGFHHVDPTQHPVAFLLIWAVVLLLLLCICLMAIIDLLYTRRLLRQALGQAP